MLAFFLGVVRFLEATFFATFFFVRELGALIAVATLSKTTPGAAVALAAAVAGHSSGRSSGMGKLAS